MRSDIYDAMRGGLDRYTGESVSQDIADSQTPPPPGVTYLQASDTANITGAWTFSTSVLLGDDASALVGFYGATPVAKTSVSALTTDTAGATYTDTERQMLQDAHDKIRTVINALRTYGLL